MYFSWKWFGRSDGELHFLWQHLWLYGILKVPDISVSIFTALGPDNQKKALLSQQLLDWLWDTFWWK
jgi:hypothetical protein